MVLRAPNESTDEDLYAGEASSGDSVWYLIGQGFLRRYDRTVLDMARQMVVLSVFPFSHGGCVLRLSLSCSTF